jgi:hypothetical protein
MGYKRGSGVIRAMVFGNLPAFVTGGPTAAAQHFSS